MIENVDDFFNIINENLWRDNISSEASMRFDKMIEYLQENKQEIISNVVQDVKRIENIKIQESKEFEYATFKKWLNKFVNETMQEYLED